MTERSKVVIVGGGFAGLAAARALKRADVDITLLDRRNFHLFQPLLYQVATGELSPANIASPLRAILRYQKNCQVLLAEVTGFDLQSKRVLLTQGEVPFDELIVATGAKHGYFGKDEWESYAPGLKSIEDATEMRRKILSAFEMAEKTVDPVERNALLTFVIVGAGPTGVELAGALSEIAHFTMRNDFRSINPREARILLVEASPRALGMYPEKLSDEAAASLKRLGVTLITGTKVTNIVSDAVELQHSDGRMEIVKTRCVVWAAGVQASSLGKKLADASGVSLDRVGRVMVEPNLSIKGYPHVFVIGDLACFTHAGGKPLPGLAPVAMQQGAYVAKMIRNRKTNATSEVKPFEYHDRGSMAVIGRYAAVALIGRTQWHGLLAWLLWLFIHLVTITQFRNRILVFIQWGWTFFTRDRAARLITHRS